MPEESSPIFPLIKTRKTPVLDMFRKKGDTSSESESESANTAQQRLGQDFQRGLASALGVSPEAIRGDLVEQWVVGWASAVVDASFWGRAEEYGRALGQILLPAIPESRSDVTDTYSAKRNKIRREVQPQFEKRDSSDISPVEF